MERPEVRKFTVVIGKNQHPVVTFEGDYVDKRELDLCIRALKKKHKEIIKKYRHDRIIATYEAKKKGQVTDDSDGQSSGSQGTAGETEGARGTGSTESTKEADAGNAGRNADPDNQRVSGVTGKVPGVTGVANPSG